MKKNQSGRVKTITERVINPNGSARIGYDNNEFMVIDPNTREVRSYQRLNNFLILKKEEGMKQKHWNLLGALRIHCAQAA